ncbi:TPA: hypothetical protein SMI21_001896 [Serratia marcescens]|nr:hypothetical protein [Serratia marcescens]HEJ7912751.1 hypothetical protein [Serratia marcescens]HEJ8074863.1 hypothetical protein [Serratia marcescens]HEJ9007100.1 hypothetical protein [Serratia marcescens]
MPFSTLLKTIVITHAKAGDVKFEIYQDEHGLFFADIWRKNSEGSWLMGHDDYSFKQAESIEDAVKSCEKYVHNLGK